MATAQVNFDGIACSVHWDGEPSLAPLLPAVAFDACLPTLRKDAQLRALTEFEAWLDACEAKVRRGEPPLLFNAPAHEPAQVELTIEIESARSRVRSEISGGAGIAVYKLLWDWLLTDAPRVVSRAELVRRLKSQRAYYRAHGIPSTRQVGRAPFAAWSDSDALAL